jgi:hypothetical protein
LPPPVLTYRSGLSRRLLLVLALLLATALILSTFQFFLTGGDLFGRQVALEDMARLGRGMRLGVQSSSVDANMLLVPVAARLPADEIVPICSRADPLDVDGPLEEAMPCRKC